MGLLKNKILPSIITAEYEVHKLLLRTNIKKCAKENKLQKHIVIFYD